MSGIIQRKSTPSGIASPSAGSVFMGVDTSGVFFTKDESGTVTVYPTESGGTDTFVTGGTYNNAIGEATFVNNTGGTFSVTGFLFTGGTVSFLSATTLSSTTLNVNFTDTLDFTTTENADFLVFPLLTGRFVGDFIGTEFHSTGYTINSGMGDGVLDLVDAGFELPFIGLLSSLEDIVSGDTVFDYVGVIDQTSIGGNVVVQKNTGLVVSDGLGGYNEYSISVQKDGSEGRLRIDKINPDGDGVYLTLRDDTTGFLTLNELASDASVHRFQSNTSTSILDLLNDNLQSDVLLANDFADDAAAALGDVPVGGLYHNGGALRIRTV